MQLNAHQLTKVRVVAGLCAYQLIAHWAIVAGGAAAAALAIASLFVLGSWIIHRAPSKPLAGGLLALVLICAVVYALYHQDSAALLLAYGIPHTAINLFLLWLFGRTLAAGREPLITRFARQFHGSIPPSIEAYARKVTILWCGFFAAQLVTSALLYVFFPATTWSFFINVLNFPMVAALFLVEYAYRLVRFRNYPHASLLTAVELFRDNAGERDR